MKISILEDNDSLRNTLVFILKKNGFHIEEFYNPNHLLKAFDNGKIPDILISDINMHEISGLEILGIIKSKYPNVEVIIMTGNTSDSLREKAHLLGAKTFLLKPFGIKQLLTAIHH